MSLCSLWDEPGVVVVLLAKHGEVTEGRDPSLLNAVSLGLLVKQQFVTNLIEI